ncbi:MAG: tetratricopeptide repeat protein [bacterium]|nr:tetratricopeptide repeat protein [bacterium]
MRKTIFFCIFILTAFIFNGFAQDTSQIRSLNFNYTSISGTVQDVNQNPVAGIKLELELAPDAELRTGINLAGAQMDEAIQALKGRVGRGVFAVAKSDEKGEYTIKGIPIPGVYIVFVRNAENYFPTRLQLSFNSTEGKVFKAPPIVLRPRDASQAVLPPKAMKEIEKSRKAAEAKDTKKAVKHLEKVLEMVPDYAEGHYNLAVLYMSEKKSDPAIKHLEAAVKINKDYKPALETLGDLYFFKKDFQNAVNYFKRFLAAREKEGELTVTDAAVYFKTGNSFKALKQDDAAVPYFQKYLEIKAKAGKAVKQDALLYNDLAARHYAKKNMDKAIACYSKAIELNPGIGADSYMYLGNCYFFKREGAKAIKYYEKYIELDPNGKHVPQVKPFLEKLKKMK